MMFALVRFVNEIDKTKRYVISVEDIHDFEPRHVLDFDNKLTYNANWSDPDVEEDSGEYVVQILKLAEKREELKHTDKRTPVPPIHTSDLEDVGREDPDFRTSRKTAMQETKRKQQNQVRAKRQQLTEVLERHTKHALLNNATAAAKTVTAAKKERKGRPAEKEENSDSSDEDSLIQMSELKNSEKEAKFWKSRYKSQCEHSAFLKRQVEFLEKNIQQQLTVFQQTLDNLISQPCQDENGAILLRRMVAELPKPAAQSTLESVRCHEKPYGDSVPAAPTPQATSVSMESACTEKAVEEAVCSNQPTQQMAEFSQCDGGLFHLSNNIIITQDQAAKLFKNKKATILIRDAAQVVWGRDTLAQRSVSGRLAPTKANSGQEPSKQLTPEKVEVVYGCLAHWGQVNNVDTTLARHTVMRTLCEKIQDCKKKLRMK